MTKVFAGILLAGLSMLRLGPAAIAAEPVDGEPCLPFTRQLAASGLVSGSLAASTAAAGVPAPAMDEAVRALETTLDLGRDLHDDDRFYVRWEQTFAMDEHPIGTPRVVWIELRTKAKGTIALHRFRARDGHEQFFRADGNATAPPDIRLPLDTVKVSSGYGLRADPLDQPVVLAAPPPAPPPAPAVAEQPAPLAPQDVKEIARAYAGFHPGEDLGRARPGYPGHNAEIDAVMAKRRARARAEEARKAEQEVEAARAAAAPPKVVETAPPPPPPQLFMHTGLDMLAVLGTPVRAAADGVVIGARPNGLYGNWVRLDHAHKLATVYAHLQRFAPGLEPGTRVARGDVIGFSGSTGRSTGPHLHFELLNDGRPVDPSTHPATRPRQLAGPDLARLRKQIAAEASERDNEQTVEEMVALSRGAPMHPI